MKKRKKYHSHQQQSQDVNKYRDALTTSTLFFFWCVQKTEIFKKYISSCLKEILHMYKINS